MEDKEQLEEQMRAVMDKHKYKRRQIRELTEDLQVIMSPTLSPPHLWCGGKNPSHHALVNQYDIHMIVGFCYW